MLAENCEYVLWWSLDLRIDLEDLASKVGLDHRC